MKLVASMIVKDEIGRYLPECIGHLRNFVDQIVVLDDGSTDGTGRWLDENADEKLIVKHLDFEDGFFAGHEGRKRQALLDFTLEQKPDWVLAIDADEFVSDGEALRAFILRQRPLGTLVMEEVWIAEKSALQIRVDGGWRPHPVPILWRAYGTNPARWKIADRALACGREPEAIRRWMAKSRPTGASIFHFGWAKQSGRQARYERYVTADGGRFHRNSHLESIMWPDMDVELERREWPIGLRRYCDLIVEHAA